MGAARKCGFPRMKLNSESMVRVAELDLSTRYHRPKRLDVGVRCLELTLPPLPTGLQRKRVFTTGSFLVTQFNASRKPVIVIGLRRSIRLVSPIRQAFSQNTLTCRRLIGIGNPASSTSTKQRSSSNEWNRRPKDGSCDCSCYAGHSDTTCCRAKCCIFCCLVPKIVRICQVRALVQIAAVLRSIND